MCFSLSVFVIIFAIEDVVKRFPDSRFYRWWRKNIIADWSDRNDV